MIVGLCLQGKGQRSLLCAFDRSVIRWRGPGPDGQKTHSTEVSRDQKPGRKMPVLRRALMCRQKS